MINLFQVIFRHYCACVRAVGIGGTRSWQSPFIFWQISQTYLNQPWGRLCPPPSILNPSYGPTAVVPMIDDVAKTGRTNSMKVYV